MPLRLVGHPALVLLALAVPLPVAGGEADLTRCRAIPEPMARLACYDAVELPSDRIALTLKGFGTSLSEVFRAESGAELRFSSDDAIFVAYLLNEAGEVVQNLHHGGAGQGRHVISQPGLYRLQINASGGWVIELDR